MPQPVTLKKLKLISSMIYKTFLELTPPKDVLFIIGGWNAKVGIQETPGVTGKFGLGVQNEAGQRLIEFCQKNGLVIANTLFQQQKRRLYTWTSPDGQHRNQIDYILCSQRRSEEHTSELQSPQDIVCRLLLEKKKEKRNEMTRIKKSVNKNKQKRTESIT